MTLYRLLCQCAAKALLLPVGMLACWPAAAACLDEVHALAESRGISSKPPVAVPDSSTAPDVTTRQLSRSGGVIAPPQTADDKSVIRPPADTDPGMMTTPDVHAPKIGGNEKAGADRTRLQAALTAAHAAAERGDEQACEDGLAKAKQIAEQR